MSVLAGYRVLVVEDDTALLLLMSHILSKKGAVVSEACNGQEALKLIGEKAFDLILSDVQMPVMTGLELLTKVREKDPKVPVFLLVTGQAQVTEDQALKMGAAGLIQKPHKMSFLIGKLEELIAKGDLKRAA